MSWPLSHEFNEAIQNPKVAFADPDLRDGEVVVGATGLPLPRSGNFADVYQMRGADGRDWAVKCFTRPVAGLGERYAKVSEALEKANLPFAVGFKFLAEGIRVGGVWRPIVKMEWVEGLLLNQVVREAAGKPQKLAAMAQMWAKLCKRLREAGLAHADLQHGNVLLVPGARAGAYGLKLIDYDGVWVPALANTPSGESGHPSFQHPARAATRAYSPDVDRFPHLVVATALKGLSVVGGALWEKYDNGDNLLFTEEDYKKPAASKAMLELWHLDDPGVQALVGRLAIACGKPIPQTPWLDQFAPDGEPSLLDEATRREAAAALGIARPVPAALPPEPTGPAPGAAEEHPDEVDVELVEEAPNRKRDRATDEKPKLRKAYRPKQSGGKGLLLAGAGAGLLVLAGVVAAVALSGGKPKETAEHKDDPPAPAVAPKPGPVAPKGPTETPTVPKPKDNVPHAPDPVPPGAPVEFKERWSAKVDDPKILSVLHIADGSGLVLAGSIQGPIRAFDLRTGAPQPDFTSKWVTRFGPLGAGMLWGQFNGTNDLQTFDAATGREVNRIAVPALPVDGPGAGTASALAPDGRHLAVARSRGAERTGARPLQIIDTGTRKPVVDTTWSGDGTFHFTADGARALVAEHGGRCRWFKLPSGDPDGEWAFDGDTANGRRHRVTALSDDGSVLGYTGPAGRPAGAHGPATVNGKSGKPLHLFPKEYFFGSEVALSADGRRAALQKSVAEPALFEVTDARTGAPVGRAQVPAGRFVMRFALARDGSTLAVLNDASKTLHVFDTGAAPGTVAPPPPAGTDPTEAPLASDPPALKARWGDAKVGEGKALDQLLFAPDANAVLLGSAAGGFEALDPKSGAPRTVGFTVLLSTSGVADFFPLANGRIGTIAPKATEIKVWDGKAGTAKGKYPVPDPGAGAGGATALRARLAPNEKHLLAARTGPPALTHPNVPLKVFEVGGGRMEELALTWTGGDVHFTADSGRVLVAEWGGRCRWFKLPSGDAAESWDLGPARAGRPHRVTGASADGLVLGYTGPAAGTERGNGSGIVDGRTGKLVRAFHRDYHANSPVAVSADGKRAALIRDIGRFSFALDVVELATGARAGRATVLFPSAPGGAAPEPPPFALAPDGRALLVYDPAHQRAHLFEVPDAPTGP